MADKAEDELNNTYQLGVSTGLAQAANFLYEQAVLKFRLHKDDEALVIRELAASLDRQAQAAHPGHKSLG